LDFYTNVGIYGSKILYRGIHEGRRVKLKLDYNPTLYIPTDQPSKFKDIHGRTLGSVQPGTMRDCRDFVKQYKDVQNFEIYGQQRYEYAFLADKFPNDVDWDISKLLIANIDIEVASENGFPDPTDANEEVVSIAMRIGKKFVVLGCGDYNNTNKNVEYIKCHDEAYLLKRFMTIWSADYPDIITGWYVKFFDIPYLINRMIKLFGEEFAKKISPWNYFSERTIVIQGREQRSYVPSGIAILDYKELYTKFAPQGASQESYTLNSICALELGERKLDYEEYGSLHTLYRDNYQLFIDYNIRDVTLVGLLEDKLKLIELALTLAYDSRSNYDDVFTQVRMWDNIIYNHLLKKNIIIPPTKFTGKDSAYVGAYVKDPIIGMHEWIASFDLNSLYPHLIMQFNISPDMFIEPDDWTEAERNVRRQDVSVDKLLNKEIDTSGLTNSILTPNAHFFRKDEKGFLAEIMEKMYNDRTVFKNKALEAKKELEVETDKTKRKEIQNRIARFDNLQLAKKVSLNSAYGALGNEFFRFFDIRQASAITTAGQLAIRWIEKKLNEYLNSLLKTKDQDYVIASDTDSIYLSLDKLVRASFGEKAATIERERIIAFMDKVCKDSIQSYIDRSYVELANYLNCPTNKMQMKREALADKGIWTAKKRYILNIYNNEGVQYAKPRIKVMGLESIKSSTPNACRKKLKDAIEIILNKDETTIQKYIEDFKTEFKTLPLGDIAFPRSVNNLQKYEGVGTAIYGFKTPIHVRGALVYNHLLKEKNLLKKYPTVKEGEKIKFIYMKEPNPVHSNIIAFATDLPKELDIHKYIDYDTQYEKSFVEPLKIILDSIGWKTEKVNSLEDFFR
jgi:DNA polymerase elongation subunit (family B)